MKTKVVLCNGLCCGENVLAKLVELLQKFFLDVSVLPVYPTDSTEDRVKRLIKMKPDVVIAFSIGTMVALRASHRAHFKRLILLAPVPLPRQLLPLEVLWTIVMHYLWKVLRGRPVILRQDDATHFFWNCGGYVKDALVVDSGKVFRTLAIDMFLGWIMFWRRWKSIPAVGTPTWIIVGKEDQTTPADLAEKIAYELHAPCSVLPHHDHFLMTDPDGGSFRERLFASLGINPAVLVECLGQP